MSIQTEKKFLPVVHALEKGCNNEAIPVKHFVEFLNNYLANQMNNTPLHNVNNCYHVCDENGEYFLTPVEILLKAQSLHTADLLVERGAEVPEPWKSPETFNTDRDYTHYLGLCPHDLWVTVRHNPHILQEENSAGKTLVNYITKASARKWATQTIEKLQGEQTLGITRSH